MIRGLSKRHGDVALAVLLVVRVSALEAQAIHKDKLHKQGQNARIGSFRSKQPRDCHSHVTVNGGPENLLALEDMTVISTPNSLSLTVPSLADSQHKLNTVPGGATLIDGERTRESTLFSTSDALAYAPGVYVGATQPGMAAGSRISMRGSDINTQTIPISGIKILRNGLPLTNADGITESESLNLNAIEQIEVYRGANALEYGTNNLGGAINLIMPTGYSTQLLRVGMTLGTDGYVNPTLSGGGVLGKGWDAYASFSYLDYNGNLDNTDQALFYGYGNLGYRWNNQNETRLHVDIQAHDFHVHGGLGKDMLAHDPHQTLARRDDPRSRSPVHRVDLQHTIKFDDDNQFDFGAYYSSKNNRFQFQGFGFFFDLAQNVGFSWRHQLNGELFGLKNRVVWGGLSQWQWINDRDYQPINANTGVLRFNERDIENNFEFYLQNQLSLNEQLTVVLGAQFNYRSTEIERKLPDLEPGLFSPGIRNTINFNPKLGLVWQVKPTLQVYGNVSRSAEPPRYPDLANIYQTPKLTSQTGTTLELGTRGGTSLLTWDLAVYHAWLHHELLTIKMPPSFVNYSVSNAGDTEHTGIELGLESTLPLHGLSQGDQLRLRGSYTWSRFQFDNDPILGNNRLPGVPEHNGRFEALYQHPLGIYFGPNVVLAGSNWVDFANTSSAKPYAVLGLRLGYNDGNHWKLFVEARNLTNERYAASVYVTGDAREPDFLGRSGSLVSPGATRSVFAGFEYRF